MGASGGNFALFIPGLGPDGANDGITFAEPRGNVYQFHGCSIHCGARLLTSVGAALVKMQGMDAKAKGSPSSYSSWPQKGKNSLKASHAYSATADGAFSQLRCTSGILGVSSQFMYPSWCFWHIYKTICLFSSLLHMATKHHSQVIAVNTLSPPEMGGKGQGDPAWP